MSYICVCSAPILFTDTITSKFIASSRADKEPLVEVLQHFNRLHWKPNLTFSFGLTWSALLSPAPLISDNFIIWFLHCCPKTSVCFLRVTINKLLTCDDLLKRYMLVDNLTCTLYGVEPETLGHLFLACLCSAYICGLCRLKLGIPLGSIDTISEEAHCSCFHFQLQS